MHHSELRSRRTKLGLTQAQLAAFLELTPNQVARMERGERPIERSHVLRWLLDDLASMHADERRAHLASYGVVSPLRSDAGS